jgi:hypothetical protein
MGKFHDLQPYPMDYWGHIIPKYIVIRPLKFAESNGYPKLLIGSLWEKRGVGWGLIALQSFCSINKGTRVFVSVRMSPLDLVMSLMAKNTKFHIFVDRI